MGYGRITTLAATRAVPLLNTESLLVHQVRAGTSGNAERNGVCFRSGRAVPDL